MVLKREGEKKRIIIINIIYKGKKEIVILIHFKSVSMTTSTKIKMQNADCQNYVYLHWKLGGPEMRSSVRFGNLEIFGRNV